MHSSPNTWPQGSTVIEVLSHALPVSSSEPWQITQMFGIFVTPASVKERSKVDEVVCSVRT